MSDPKENSVRRRADFSAWEDAADRDKQTQQERIASEVFLAALGSTENFRKKVFLKGGVLVGAVYESGRNTADLDFSTILEPTKEFLGNLEEELARALPAAAAQVGSPETIIKVQSVKYRPRPETFVEANAPAIEVKFAYAQRGSKSEERLKSGNSSEVLYADISFNEEICSVDEICIGDTGLTFFAYSKCDLVAEKLRSVLQQKTRRRNRRQDIYDLWFILENYPLQKGELDEIKETFVIKCRSRDIVPDSNSFKDDEVIERSKADWSTLESEVTTLPEFEAAFETVAKFYLTLWQ